MRHPRCSTASACCILSLLFASRAAGYSVTVTQTILDLPGFAIEDFEDTELIAGLSYLDPVTGVELHALPNLFRRPDDAWDGVHVLSNFTQNTGGGNTDIGTLEILIADGANSVAFGMSQLQFPQEGPHWEINGIPQGNPGEIPGVIIGQQHNGFLRIEREAGDEPIASISITKAPNRADLITIDHVAFIGVSEPVFGMTEAGAATLAALLAAAGAMLVRRRCDRAIEPVVRG